MRAAVAVLLAALVAAAAAVARAAAPQGQPRLGAAAADRALLLPRGAAAAGALPADPRPWTARLRDDPPCTWWGRLRGRCPWRNVLVAPLRPNGAGLAPPAMLRLPPDQLAAERRQGLQPAAPPPHLGAAAADSEFFSYNSSAMTPLVPLWAAWMTDAARMANRSHGLDFETAWRLSSYVAISYCNTSTIADWSCSRCNGISAGFEPEEVVADDAWDLQGYVGFSRPMQAIVVAFRGTDSHSIYNWVQNMRTWRTDLALNYPGAPQRALVHGGFLTSYNSSALAANVTAAVARLRARHPGAPVYVSGHSLGGALATLCALDLKLNQGVTDPPPRLYTFGSPRVGNAVFADWFEREIEVHWRFTHNRDIVPSVPPGYMGFYHLSREVWLLDLFLGRTLVGVCDASGEDMACHNSMCHLGLCSSVADHLLYLSEMYAPRPYGC